MPCLRHILWHGTVILSTLLLGFGCCVLSEVIRQCEKEGPCKCNAGVVWSIDLHPLDGGNTPRFSVNTSEINSTVSYSTIYFNPCQNFWAKNATFGLCGGPDGVALCHVNFVNSTLSEYKDLGSHSTSTFSTTGLYPQENVTITFTSADKRTTTTVNLKCDPKDETGTLKLNHGSKVDNNYALTLSSKYCCANAAPDGGLSVGSALLIIFFVMLILYLTIGMVYNHCVMGATGLEIVPHYEFWIDFPFLVRDGILFLFNGCKTEPSYDRI